MSENGERGALESVDALLRHAVDAVSKLIVAEFSKIHNDDISAVGHQLELVQRLTWAAQVAFADEVDQRGMAAAHSVSSTQVLLRQMLNISAREAGLRVRTARAVHAQDLPSGGEMPPQLPVLGAAVTAGLVDADHTRIVMDTIKILPRTLEPEVVTEAEQALVDHALDLDPDQFRKVAQRLADALDPDGTLDDREPLSKIEFHIGARSASTGLTSITGKLDDLSMATMRTVIDSLAAPQPEFNGIKDPRPAAVRRAQALVEVFNHALTQGNLPAHAGERPTVTVTLNWDILNKHVGHAVTDHGTTLSPATTRRLLCDAKIIPAVLNGESEVFNLGRSARTFSRAIRRAITVRDKGCVFPGCDRPPDWCECHHIDWWVRDLGDTSYQNGCLMCAYHHSEIHKGQWRIHLAPDGVPEFIPPRWIDQEQRPRRNTVHSLAPETG